MNEQKVVIIVLDGEGKPVDSFGPFSSEDSANEWLDENEHQFDDEEVVVIPCTSEEDDVEEEDELEEEDEIEGDEISEEDEDEEDETERKIKRYKDEEEDEFEEEDEDLDDELEDYEEEEDGEVEEEDDYDYDEDEEDTLDESAPAAPVAPPKPSTKPAPVRKPEDEEEEEEEEQDEEGHEEQGEEQDEPYSTPMPIEDPDQYSNMPKRLPPLPDGMPSSGLRSSGSGSKRLPPLPDDSLDEGILNRAMARGRGVLDSIGTLGKNIGSAGKAVFKGTGKKPLRLDAPADAYKGGKIKSIANSSAKDLLADWSKLGLIANPSSQDIEELAKVFVEILSENPAPRSRKSPSKKPSPKRGSTSKPTPKGGKKNMIGTKINKINQAGSSQQMGNEEEPV